MKKYPMSKGEGGVWATNTEPLVPGFHHYSILINGVLVCDPASEAFCGMGRMASGIEIPAVGEDFHQTAEGELFHNSVKGYRDALETAGIQTIYYESPGTAHEWQTWRRSLREFAPLLFMSERSASAR